MVRKKKKRLRIDRVIICLLILIFIIFLIIFGNYSLKNLKIYNSVKKGNVIKLHNKKVKLWKKTINYVKENKNEITIKYKKNYITIPASELKNKMIINLDIEKKKINKPLFNNVKVLYINDTDTLEKSNKLKVKLPMFLYKNKTVDVYAVKNNGEYELINSNKKVNNKYISFKINNKYKDYFICYIKLKDYTINENVTLKKDEEYDINVNFNPSNATNKNIKYKVKDDSIIYLKDNIIKPLKEGKTTIEINSNDINKTINVEVKGDKTVLSEEKETKKEETKYKVTVKNGITYVDGIMIVNKTYSLPKDYNPGLEKIYKDAFSEMQSAAKLDNINIFIASGFRSYDYQKKIYDAYVKEDGKEKADTYSARPGYSEHQSGLAADINTAASWFDDTAEAKWLKENCYKYGFIVRFPKGEEEYTGYKYESWHLRYVGKDIAKKIHEAGDISLEHYYGLTSKYKD